MFVQACKESDIWDFSFKKGSTPIMSDSLIKRYRNEIEMGKECFCLLSEKQKISPLFPLTSFSEAPSK
jgi:hypothetical protein